MTCEINFDGLIGPTHNYSGLSLGNLASANHSLQTSHPRAAAIQGLSKMRALVKRGYQQGILLPQIRPDLNVLRALGFSGDNQRIINQVAKQSPELLAMVYSASSMWAANAATVSPSADTEDGKVHFTTANLTSTTHRSFESAQTTRCLQKIFSDEDHFSVHEALPANLAFGDEGAANHSRLCASYGDQGVGLFVYGQGLDGVSPRKFPARQTLAASQAVARQHGVLQRSVFVQQNPAAIDAGAFHNDVVAVANGPVIFFHELAYREGHLAQAQELMMSKMELKTICVPENKVSLEDAIKSYLFNSQLLASSTGSMDEMILVAPLECREMASVNAYLEALTQDKSQPIREVMFVDVRQSMSNGGGPACLRLRVVLTENELAAVHSGFLLDESKIDLLVQWVDRHYREDLSPADLADPQLMLESQRALADLSELLGLDGYFQIQD